VAPSNIFCVPMQGHAVMSVRRVRSSPSLSALCGHPRHCRTTPDTVATSQRCWDVRGQDIATTATVPRTDLVNGTLELVHHGVSQPTATPPPSRPPPVRAQDAPRRLNRSGICQDGRQLRNTVRHTSTRRKIVRCACKLLPPWPIKGGAAPSRGDTGRRTAVTHTLSAFPTILALASIKPLGLGGHASSPASLVATPLRAPRCEQYSAPSTPLLDVRPQPEPG
jgi:hypothetical protein